jgi:hypothetical protein
VKFDPHNASQAQPQPPAQVALPHQAPPPTTK